MTYCRWRLLIVRLYVVYYIGIIASDYRVACAVIVKDCIISCHMNLAQDAFHRSATFQNSCLVFWHCYRVSDECIRKNSIPKSKNVPSSLEEHFKKRDMKFLLIELHEPSNCSGNWPFISMWVIKTTGREWFQLQTNIYHRILPHPSN